MATLHHCAGSRGLRPLWTIEELQIPCDLVVHPYPPRAKVPGFLDTNPLGTVPYFVDGATRMTESMPISVYLATRDGPTPLVVQPAERDYGVYLDLVEYGEASLTNALAVRVRFRFSQADLGLQAAGDVYGERFCGYLAHIEQLLDDGREYLAAGRFTLADVSVGYALYLARLSGLGERLTSRSAAYADRLFARPGFSRALEREAFPRQPA